MKGEKKKEVKTRLALQFMRKVFYFYLAVVVGVTLFHMYLEFLNTRHRVQEELKAIGEAFEPGLAKALWDINLGQLKPTFLGMIKSPTVKGVKLKNERDKEIGSSGLVTTSEGEIVEVTREGEKVASHQYQWLLPHRFPIYYQRNGKKILMGEATIYSSLNVVFHRVKSVFLVIFLSAMINVFSLWVLFLWVSRSMLSEPLATLTEATRQISMDRLEDLKIEVKTEGRNELKVLEEAFNSMIGKLRDARTKHINFARELEESRKQLHDIINNASAVIFVKDVEGRYILINQKFEQLFHFTEEEVLGKTDGELFPPELADPFMENDQKVLQKGEPMKLEEKAPHDDGLHTYISVKFPLRDSQGKIYALCGIATDITEIKKAEEVLKNYSDHLEMEVRKRTEELKLAKETAEAANRAKSDFLAKMSHELRTPLNAVLGLTQRTLDTDLTSEQRDNLAHVNSSSQTLLALINDILDFSKIEAGKLELEVIPFDLEQLLSQVRSQVALEAQKKDLALHFQIGKDIPPFLWGDPLRLAQILTNLLSNAIKFTEEGEVTLQVQVISQKEERGRIDLEFSVIDTGIGIAPEVKSKLFQSFQQGETSTTRKYGGTGLGLSICRQLVEMMGGEIRLESEVGKGSVFSFVISFVSHAPLALAPSTQESYLSSPTFRELGFSTSLRKCRLLKNRQGDLATIEALVIEDNSLNQEVVSGLLKDRGMEVTLAERGREGIEKLKKDDFDLILMDIDMPEMDGYEATKRIRKLGIFTPIIALTAHSLEGEKEKCLEAGMNDYLTKPIEEIQLIGTILRCLPNVIRAPFPKGGLEIKEGDRPVGLPSELLKKRALVRLGGKEHLLKKLWKKTYQRYQETPSRFEEAIEEGDFEYMERKCHNLKGVAGTLSATGMARVSARLEKAAKKKDKKEIERVFIEWKEEWIAFANLVEGSGILDEDEELKKRSPSRPSLGEEEREELKPLVRNLYQHLERGSFESVKLVGELLNSSSLCDLDQELEEISQFAEDFEFEEALKRLAKVAQSLEIDLEEES